jgi:hypothetical protein
VRRQFYINETVVCLDNLRGIAIDFEELTVSTGDAKIACENMNELVAVLVLVHVVFRVKYPDGGATFLNWIQFLLNIHDHFEKFPDYFFKGLCRRGLKVVPKKRKSKDN